MSFSLVDMIKSLFEPVEGITDMTATIVPTNNGFGLFTRDGLVQEYSRSRDAKRGAARRGLVVA